MKALAALVASFLLAGVASAQSVAPQLAITSVSAAGSACPAGTTAVSISEDKKAITVLFQSYGLEVGAAARTYFSYKQCNVSLKVKGPAGWSFAPYTFDYRGFTNLAANTHSILLSSYFFNGIFRHVDQFRQHGPLAEDFVHRATLPNAPLWSPCNGAPQDIKVATQAWLYGREGTWNLDSLDGEMGKSQTIGLLWKRCH